MNRPVNKNMKLTRRQKEVMKYLKGTSEGIISSIRDKDRRVALNLVKKGILGIKISASTFEYFWIKKI